MTPDEEITPRWFLRMDDGKTYGPVTFGVLRDWADQARVGPGTQVSSDGTTWTPPEDIPELAIEWMVLAQGQDPYGPLSRPGVIQLVRDGVIPLGAQVRNRKTGLDTTVGEWVALAEAKERQRIETQLAGLREELQRALDRARQSEEAARAEKALHAQAEAERAENERIRAQAEAESADREQALRAKVAALEQQAQSLAAAARQEQDRWERDRTEVARRTDEAGRRIAALEKDAAAAQTALREKDALCRSLQAETRELSDESARRIQTLTAERDAALAGTSAERGALTQEQARGKAREAELMRQIDEAGRRNTAIEAHAAAVQDAFRERDAFCQHLQAEARKSSDESARRIQALTAERDAALARVSAEQDDRSQEQALDQTRLKERETELVRQLDEAGRRSAALAVDAAAAQDALRERDALCRRLRAESDNLSDESARRIQALAAERDAAIRHANDLRSEMARAQSAASESLARREDQARSQSDRIRALEEQIGKLGAESAREREAFERLKTEWQAASDEKARALAESLHRADGAEDARSKAQAALQQALDDLAKERNSTGKADTEQGQREYRLRRQATEAQEKAGRLSADLLDAKRQREAAVHELGVVREELRRANDTIARLAKTVTAPSPLGAPPTQPPRGTPRVAPPRVGGPGMQTRPTPVAGAAARPSAVLSAAPPSATDADAAQAPTKGAERGDACPECGSMNVIRGRRTFWLRLLVLTRRYTCNDCACDFVTFVGRFKHRLG